MGKGGLGGGMRGVGDCIGLTHPPSLRPATGAP